MKIFVLSGQNEAANARHARALGAWDFIAKPADPASIARALARGLERPRPRTPSSSARARRSQAQEPDRAVRRRALPGADRRRVGQLVATRLHRLSPRAGRPYFSLNCAAISPQLVEPTLFGYVKGAFTGAATTKAGFFEDAADGTLFLDEIGELPLDMQAKLLRVLENGEYQRVGETQRRTARCRVIAATNRDLRRAVREGAFRADLYHRLSVFTPAYRRCASWSRTSCSCSSISGAVGQALRAGRSGHRALAALRLPRQRARAAQHRHPPLGQVPGQRLSACRARARARPRYRDAGRSQPDRRAGAAQLERGGQFDLDQTLKAWERGYIEAALRLTRGNVSQAAKLLGINRTTLYSRMSTGEEK